jgi:hypothetical protein
MSDASAVDLEEALVASLSNCHPAAKCRAAAEAGRARNLLACPQCGVHSVVSTVWTVYLNELRLAGEVGLALFLTVWAANIECGHKRCCRFHMPGDNRNSSGNAPVT